MEEIRKIPPVTRALLGATLAITLPVTLALTNVYNFALFWPHVRRTWQFYRIFTSFFYAGSGLTLVFDCFFLYRNSSDLELNHFGRRTADYAWSLLVMAGVILATNAPLNSAIHFQQLLMGLTYVWSRANVNSRVNLFGMITIPAIWLPWTYAGMALLQGGLPAALQSATGIFAGYVYWTLAQVWPSQRGGRSYIPTPGFLRSIMPDSVDPALAGHNIGDRQARRTAGGIAWNSAPRSRGNRLGDGDVTSSSSSTPSSIASALGAGTRSTIGRLNPFSGSASGSSGSTGRAGPDREAMLAAAERRLRASQSSSIVSRNASDRATTASTASKPAPAGGSIGSTSINTSSSSTSTTNLRKTAAAPGSTNTFTFGQLNQQNNPDRRDPEEDHSSSGGAVAEQRRPANSTDSSQHASTSPSTSSAAYAWGSSGRRLGE
ncbi:DER1-domain-containing protein [Testicularia cyperi]|uniref:Derlin n=1 Tax=Testicularia cyperi TaxID=1882483 RepID=A0A317XWH2_9BASI|nr:DER1-domain-containing protein [Testicularia cyperi]